MWLEHSDQVVKVVKVRLEKSRAVRDGVWVVPCTVAQAKGEKGPAIQPVLCSPSPVPGMRLNSSKEGVLC